MRTSKYQTGDIRIIYKFLIFPKRLPNFNTEKMETRWLEFTCIKQECYNTKSIFSWNDICWYN